MSSYEEKKILRLRLRAIHERLNAVIVQARLLSPTNRTLECSLWEGAEAEAAAVSRRIVAAVMPDIDRLEKAAQLAGTLRLAADAGDDLSEACKGIELCVRELERGKETERGQEKREGECPPDLNELGGRGPRASGRRRVPAGARAN